MGMDIILSNLKNTILETVGIEVTENDVNLLSEEFGINFVRWIYIIHRLENEFRYPVITIIKENEYDVFTLNNLAKKIKEKQNS